jgi:nitrogen-specific signal transduction histidine kinase
VWFCPIEEINKVASIAKDVVYPFTRVRIQKEYTGLISSTRVYGDRERIKQVLLNCLKCCLDKT